MWRPLSIVAVLILAAASPALADTGVSEERLSLPDGPGSLEGIGENIELNHNMALMSYQVKIQAPEGFPGMTPSLSLDYSSGGGASVVGMGWNLLLPSIERLTVRGLPRYTLEDELSADGGAELVYVSGTEPRTYRSRFEQGFVRYRWHDAGDGTEGFWTAEHPDGRISYFGADHEGTEVATARVGGDQGTFRWHLVEIVDRYGHVLRYSYGKYGSVTLPNQVGWVFDGADPRYSVTFQYGDRTDQVSDCKGGFEELLTKRLTRVNVMVGDTRIRRYDLSYEDYATSGGFSRLTGVDLYGLEDGLSPIRHGFEYSRALGVDCQAGQDCALPYVTDMGSLGVDLAQGKTTLIDINGDALPDVVDSSEPGAPHRFFLNHLSADGPHAFEGPVQSVVGSQGSHPKDSPFVHVLDVDGDGFTDMLNAQTGKVLRNEGAGDWTEAYDLFGGDGGLPNLGAEGMLESVKFLDYDGDKRIDLVFSKYAGALNETIVYRNTGSGF
ncbi:MAG: hypothetical protein FJ098_16125, partial [Deltaproteobacteria bacterium]|nr:hypothetical protein [Deltaproteobacteria bacterium]